MIRILLVEDDVEIARIIKYFLGQEEIYDVVWAKSANEAENLSRDWFDTILLDVMLPDVDGISLCARLRQWHRCPIIFISCLDDSDTIISALDRGGDDYIVKPFDNKVLSARIQANLRRVQMERQGDTENTLSCYGFSLDAANHILLKDGVPIPLAPMEFRLLRHFMQNPGRCFRASELYKILWEKNSYGDNRTVVVHIHNLRRKIEQDVSQPRYLKSVWGKGYCFDPEGKHAPLFGDDL